MELRLKLSRVDGSELPVNYQYYISSWIYNVIAQADAGHSTFLHDRGYEFGFRTFKLFTFSHLDIRPFQIVGNKIRVLGNEMILIVRFLVDASLETFVKGLFIEQQGFIGSGPNRVDFRVTSVDVIAKPQFKETMRYRCLSPMVVSTRRDDGSVAYLDPLDRRFASAFVQNLIRKHHAVSVYNEIALEDDWSSYPFSLRVIGLPRKKGVTIKEGLPDQTKVIGHLFNFELRAPEILQEIGYYAGFGEKNSMGFGCVAGGR